MRARGHRAPIDDDEESRELPTTGLLSFYDRLRERVVREVERRGGKLGSGAAQALLLVPDVFILAVRLMLDREVPQSTRVLLGSALGWLFDAVLGVAGAEVGALDPGAKVGFGSPLGDHQADVAVVVGPQQLDRHRLGPDGRSGPDEVVKEVARGRGVGEIPADRLFLDAGRPS